jgi:uncharacterized OB-fold protein
MSEMSAAMREFARRANGEGLELQRCDACGAVQWPPREVCGACWSDALQWREVSQSGVLIATTTLHVSMESFFRARLPWRVGTVRLDAGPVAYAHLHERAQEGEAVRVEAHGDVKGRGVLIALPADGAPLEDDVKLQELISTREE